MPRDVVPIRRPLFSPFRRQFHQPVMREDDVSAVADKQAGPHVDA